MLLEDTDDLSYDEFESYITKGAKIAKDNKITLTKFKETIILHFGNVAGSDEELEEAYESYLIDLAFQGWKTPITWGIVYYG